MANIPVQVVISAVDNASKVLSGVGKEVQKQAADWRGLSLIVSGATVAMGAALTSFAREASKTDAVKGAFNAMTKGVVKDADTFVVAMKKASAGTMSEYDIIVNANRTLSLIGKEAFGKDFTGTFTNAMEMIRKASRATGYDISYLTESFVLGIGRQSKMILDNLGITTDITGALDQYAKKLGKTAEELTAEEQKTATLNHVMDLLNKRYKDVNLGTASLDEEMQALNAQWRDMRDELGRRFIPVISKLLKEVIIPFVENYGPKMADWLDKMITSFAKLPDPIQKVLAGLAVLGALAAPILGLVSTISKLVTAFSATYGVLAVKLTPVFIWLKGILLAIGSVLAGLNPIVWIIIGAVTALAAIVFVLIKNWETVVEVFGKIRDSLGEIFKGMGNLFFDFVALALALVEKLSGGWVSKTVEMWNRVVNKFQEGKSAVERVVVSVIDGIINLYNRGRDSVVGAVSGMVDGIKGRFNDLINYMGGILDRIKGIINNIRDWVGSNWANWGIHINLPDLGGMISRWKNGMSNWAKDKINKLPDFLKGIAEQYYIIRGNLPSFDEGGVIPGPVGSPQLVVAHGGERVTSNQGNGGGGGVNLTVNVGIYAGSAIEKRQLAVELWNELGRLARSTNKTPEQLIGF